MHKITFLRANAVLFMTLAVTLRALAGPITQATKNASMQPSAQQQGHMLDMWDRALHLTGAQKAKIGPLLNTSTAQVRAIYSNRSLSPQQQQSQMQAIWQSTQTRIRQILTPAQRKQLDLMQQQALQGDAQRRQEGEKINRALNLTPQQKNRIQALLRQTMQQEQAIQTSKSLSPQQKQTQLLQLRVAMRSHMQQVLTADQRKKLTALQADRKARNQR